MARLLIYGNPHSPLVGARGRLGLQAGHEIHWFAALPAPFPDVVAHAMPGWARAPFARLLLEPFFLSKTLYAIQPDLVHVHYASKGLAALPLARWRGPLVVTAMGSDILPVQGTAWPYLPMTRRLLERADAITSKSDFMDTALQRIGDYSSKLHRITWGIDLTTFRPDLDTIALRQAWRIPAETLVFLDPRGGSALYNKHIILMAFARYVQEGGPAAVLLVAEVTPDPAYMASLRRQAEELGIADSVRFVGHLLHDRMAGVFALADLTLSVPVSDGLPQSLYEALACGSFPIVGDLPQYDGVVQDGVTGLRVPVGDGDALALAMKQAASQPDLRQRAAVLGRAYVEQHADARVETAKLLALYEIL
ncbi:MAG: glycosyltransferase [Anaerolineae bacterium]|nr:MAG: glycosyltransferase [Anaerolineae bacterium]